MIDEKKLREAAETAFKKVSLPMAKESLERSFCESAEWLVKNIWHPITEEPQHEGLIVRASIIDGRMRADVTDYMYLKRVFMDIAESDHDSKEELDRQLKLLLIGREMSRWCYLSDIMPACFQASDIQIESW